MTVTLDRQQFPGPLRHAGQGSLVPLMHVCEPMLPLGKLAHSELWRHDKGNQLKTSNQTPAACPWTQLRTALKGSTTFAPEALRPLLPDPSCVAWR